MTLHLGCLGGRYRLLEKIGLGSMAVVYRAIDELLEREVAVKVMQSAATNDAELRRSDAEVKLLARLNHYGLVTLLDAGTERSALGTPCIFLVMELVEGPDLRNRLMAGPLAHSRTVQVGHDVTQALEYIHRKGVVHRDIKPANILLFDDGATRTRAKLTDFGIARMAESALTLEDAVSGTPAYLSPEQVRGEPVGPESDVYSFGLVLLQCLTGELAFPGPPLESAVRRLTQAPPIPEGIGGAWRELISGMTAMDPAERPPAAAAAVALQRMMALEVVADVSVAAV
ncbi:serine/threonine-protein kinase [Sinomonas gamaensis]|uniref:serine/threonine-protein kinase n=1 Tax=Sinomonas gamaensis TaxID=2565624 RepID=UPI001109D3C1|nr:serine/threonine-protein kinase [Sinomonas gamaensis]